MNGNKSQMVEAFSRFLDQMGMEGMETDEYGENPAIDGGRLPVWAELDASMLGQGMGPLHSKESLFKMDDQIPMQMDQYGMPQGSDQEEMMIAMGMI